MRTITFIITVGNDDRATTLRDAGLTIMPEGLYPILVRKPGEVLQFTAFFPEEPFRHHQALEIMFHLNLECPGVQDVLIFAKHCLYVLGGEPKLLIISRGGMSHILSRNKDGEKALGPAGSTLWDGSFGFLGVELLAPTPVCAGKPYDFAELEG